MRAFIAARLLHRPRVLKLLALKQARMAKKRRLTKKPRPPSKADMVPFVFRSRHDVATKKPAISSEPRDSEHKLVLSLRSFLAPIIEEALERSCEYPMEVESILEAICQGLGQTVLEFRRHQYHG